MDELDDTLQPLLDRPAVKTFELKYPTEHERSVFFLPVKQALLSTTTIVSKPPATQAPISEVLPLAPIVKNNQAERSSAKTQTLKDKKTRLTLQAKLGPLMELIRTRYKRFKKPCIVILNVLAC